MLFSKPAAAFAPVPASASASTQLWLPPASRLLWWIFFAQHEVTLQGQAERALPVDYCLSTITARIKFRKHIPTVNCTAAKNAQVIGAR